MPAERLAGATSPYLRQHAADPVEWYPWGGEALETARRLRRPILLSIGYSACHWCHVMARESFSDPAVAELMNRLYINVKVDREERPDLDRLYQAAQQLITGRSGGWPLTMFLTPDELTPFFGGTYFAPQGRHGLPGFAEVLEGVAAFWRERPDEVLEQGRAVAGILPRLEPETATIEPLDAAPLAAVREALAAGFDAEYGGFGEAPKFPHATGLGRLLRHWRASATSDEPDVQALYMATMTLARMADGGLYDQLGGGFFRYSTDRYWRVPHFEKMLCDNAQLLALYAETWRISGEERWRGVARELAGWVMREMQAAEGGYLTSLDADGDDGEGSFYLWTPEEARACLDADQAEVALPALGLDQAANFEGRWHLWRALEPATLARRLQLPVSTVEARLTAARAVLLEARAQRRPPGCDDKVLTGWNALMITGMAIAARALGEHAPAESARRAMAFVRSTLWRDGQLLAAHARGQSHTPAWLDDHALLLEAALALLELEWDGELLEFAVTLAEAMLERFEDRVRGGFHFTSEEHDTPLHRARQFGDEATPSGNAVAAWALQRLGLLLAEPRYLEAAERTLRAAWPALQEHPQAHCRLLDALEEHLDPPQLVIIRGDGEAALRMREVATAVYAPRRMTLLIPAGASGLPPALAARHAAGAAVAWVCNGLQCGAALTQPEALAAALAGS